MLLDSYRLVVGDFVMYAFGFVAYLSCRQKCGAAFYTDDLFRGTLRAVSEPILRDSDRMQSPELKTLSQDSLGTGRPGYLWSVVDTARLIHPELVVRLQRHAMSGSTHERFDCDEPSMASSDRQFGLVFAIAFSIIGLAPLLRNRPPRLWALGGAAVFLLAALLLPRLLGPLNVIWTRLGLLLGRVTNPIILGIMFYFVLTPIAALLRIMGKISVPKTFDRAAATYWIERCPPGPPPQTMRQQF